MKSRIKYLIGFIVIIGILVYLFLTSFRSSLQYYVTVSELWGQQSHYQDKTLKVAGVAKHIRNYEKEGKRYYEFQVEEGGQLLAVVYQGFVPDTFKEDSQVVLTGSLSSSGTFYATHILAKCASKYETKIN